MNNHPICKNWKVLKLNEICITRSGVLTSRHHCTLHEGNIPYIKPKDINFNTIIRTTEHVSEDIIRKAGVEIAQKESILIAVSGSNAGNIALLGKDAVVNQSVFYTTIHNPLIKPKFLYYYLLFKRNLLFKVSKYAVRVSYRHLQKLGIPLPSLKEQEQIIQNLDIHLSQINTSINNIKNTIADIEKNKQQLLNKIFSFSSITKAYTKWENLKLSDCGTIQAGRTPNGSIKGYYGSDYPLFKPSDLRPQMYLNSAETNLSAKGLKEARHVSANSILICSSGISFGKAGITRVEGACNQQMIAFKPGINLITEFVYFQMNADCFKKQLLKNSNNSMVKKSSFKNLMLRVPSVNIQRNIVKKIFGEMDLLTNKETNLYKKMSLLDDSKCNLLLRSFTHE